MGRKESKIYIQLRSLFKHFLFRGASVRKLIDFWFWAAKLFQWKESSPSGVKKTFAQTAKKTNFEMLLFIYNIDILDGDAGKENVKLHFLKSVDSSWMIKMPPMRFSRLVFLT